MTNSHQPTKDREIKKTPIYTISDGNGYSPSSPSTSTSSEGKDEEPWKDFPINPPDDPIDQYYRRYSTIQPAPPNTLYEKRHERGRLPKYLKQMNSQSSEAPSETPSRRSAKGRRSRTPKKRSRFLRSIHYIGSHHHLFGLRHIVLVLILVVAWLLGSLLFWAIEAPAEKVSVADTYNQLHEAFEVIAADLQTISRTKNGTGMTEHVKQAYVKLLNIEGKYRWSAIHKIESSSDGTYTWTFASAFFFTFTLFTTVGYGTIAPGTDLGRVCTIWYSCIFYPFSIVVIRDLGQLTLVAMTRIYGKLLIKIRQVRGYLTSENDTISLPITITLSVSAIFIAIAGVFFHYYDKASGTLEGLNNFHAFYFSYLSYTAIGLGDLNPVNAPYSPLVAILVTAGLPLMRVVTKAIYVAMENGYFGTMMYIESKLEGKVFSSEEAKIEKQVAGETGDIDSCCDSSDDENEEERKIREELMQNFTIRSLAKFMTSNRDVYNGDYGRVEFRKSDL